MRRSPNSMSDSQAADTTMERMWFHLDHRVCYFWMRHTSGTQRRFFEHLLLLSAILCFGLLIIMHKHFVFRTGHNNCASTCLLDFNKQADLIHLAIQPYQNQSTSFLSAERLADINMHEHELLWPDLCSSKENNISLTNILTIEYSYSKTKAYLLLEPNNPLLDQLNVQYVVVSPNDLKCFGDGGLQFLVWRLGVGWDTILVNWLLVFNQADETSFVYHRKTQRLLELTLPSSPASLSMQYLLRVSLVKLGVLIQTSFLFFFSTSLVSFTLNETQERMLEFTQELSRRVGHNLPLGNLVTTHVLNSLIFCPLMVGKMFFLVEFYKGDKFLAFLVMSLVWLVEVYTVLSLRSWQGITYFSRIFFLLFCLFHVYYFATPKTGFSYIAFWVVVLFIIHSMMFFWRRYELPAVAFGYINAQRPRANILLQPLQPFLRTPPRVQRTNRVVGENNGVIEEIGLLMQGNHSLLPEEDLANSRHSFSTTTSSSSNRNAFPFRSGNNEDDEDESYAYFMEGEIVVHRNEETTIAEQNFCDGEGEIFRQRPEVIENRTSTDTTSVNTFLANANNMDAVRDDSQIVFEVSTLGREETEAQNYSQESSGLQAILEVRLSPRRQIQSSAGVRKGRTVTACEPPPAFPDLQS